MSFTICLDAHSDSCEFAVYKDNKNLVDCKRISTSEMELIDYVRGYKSPKVLIFEESTMSQWLYDLFLPYCDDIIVSESHHNALIYRGEQKSDKSDPRNLLTLHVADRLKRVYHSSYGKMGELKRIVLQYHSYVSNSSSFKNKIHAKYRQNGVFIRGRNRHVKSGREEYMKGIDDASGYIIRSLYEVLEELEKKRKEFLKLMKLYSKEYRVIKEFKKIPGVGDITAITFFALIGTPKRFKTKSKLWTYCRLGIATKESGGIIYSQKLNHKGHSLLKCVALQATTASINKQDSCFQKMYYRLLERGLSPKLARITIARKIISTMYYIWLKGFTFDEKFIN